LLIFSVAAARLDQQPHLVAPAGQLIGLQQSAQRLGAELMLDMPGHHAEPAVSCPDVVLADTFHQISDRGSAEWIGTQIVTVSVGERRR